MDALYALGTGSPYQNLELKYSLRSLERNGIGIDRIVIIGEKPNFLDYNIIQHYTFRENGVKDFRIASKINYACQSGIVSDDFLFLNDDFFFTKKFDSATYPYYQKGALLVGGAMSSYQEHLKLTRDYLKKNGKKTIHFDVHTPIVYNAEKFIELKDCWEYSRNTIGLVVKSTYCNMHGITGPAYTDVKLKTLRTADDFKKIESTHVFSINDAPWNLDRAWHKGVFEYLHKHFPEKSRFEI